MQITKRMEFDAAHRIPWHTSKCKNLHGHRYVVEVTIEGPVLDDNENPESGMVLDFGTLKAAMETVIDPLDHSLIMGKDDPALATMSAVALTFNWTLNILDHIPTAERIAEYLAQRIQGELCTNTGRSSIPPIVSRIVVWETPTSKAIWSFFESLEDDGR